MPLLRTAARRSRHPQQRDLLPASAAGPRVVLHYWVARDKNIVVWSLNSIDNDQTDGNTYKCIYT